MNGSDPGATLRARIEAAEIAVMPGVYDALSGMLAEGAGFETVFTSGFSISATQLGKPDLGLLTMSENLRQIRSIVPSLSVPLVADLDTGYGNALNVRRTIEEAMDAGVAGGILEDQQWPKRCGHMEEKSVIDADDHARRIRAAADVRAERDGDFVIIGRTDAREPHGLEEAVRRGHIYADAGADVVFVEAPRSRAELEAVAEEFDVPTFANMIEGGQTPYLPASELDAIGFDIVVYPLSGLFAATRALQETYAALAADGTAGAAETVDFEAFEAAIGAEAFRERERRYAEQSDGG
ncbi:isocitrate lyase/PEP mutase family protein [Halobellus ruber]|uniref:Isocitrate lyase/PEP mutase family protein n=1 Tax=Halobellus ruber TaxID=2761102 RepID=A0A7J9SEV3_9EURY|nr:isocitrate lyase/PEP mutase family protein [Halobellus ruber]MBB6645485.1 isocitrate lyase/PEP mutase family protein [Halobellus ruber]